MTNSFNPAEPADPASVLQLENLAIRILILIEARSLYQLSQSRRLNQAYFSAGSKFSAGSSPRTTSPGEKTSSPAMPPMVTPTGALTPAAINQSASQWKKLVPLDPNLRAALLHVFIRKYGAQALSYMRLQEALGSGDPSVCQAFHTLYGQELDAFLLEFASPAPAVSGMRDQDHQESAAPATGSVPGAEVAVPIGLDPETLTTALEQAAEPLISEDWNLQELEEKMDWVSLGGGEYLYRQGDPSDALYIVVSGRLRVVMPGEVLAAAEGQPTGDQSPNCFSLIDEQIVKEAGRGEMLGEGGVLTAEPRTTSVYALRDSELIKLDRLELEKLAEKHPQLLLRFSRLVVRQLRQPQAQASRPAETLVTFAVVPTHRRTPSREFTAMLVYALSDWGSVLHLTSSIVEEQRGLGSAQIPIDHPDNGSLASWLSEKEAEHRYVVYEADPQPTEWTRRCARQSDRILLLAEAAGSPSLSPVESLLTEMLEAANPSLVSPSSSIDLVLLHPPSTRRPSDTARWLASRPVAAHYHVRLGNTADVQRLARRLSGRALGLVLGGGGARGYAHIGVHRALQETGFQIDLIGGSSMGALVGGLFAMDLDYDNILSLIRKLSYPSKLFDPTLPLVSFFSSEKVGRVLDQAFGDVQIEDLWKPFFCVSSNLTRARLIVHTRGSLRKAVRASLAIPGIFSPVLQDNELLVDGGVLNNLPIDIMQDFSQGSPQIAVNVFPDTDLEKEYDFGDSVSGWALLARKLNPFVGDIKAPWIFESLIRVIALNDVRQAHKKAGLADLYLRPPVESYGLLDFGSYEKIIETGYRYAQMALQSWKAGEGDEPSRLSLSLPPSPLNQLNAALEETLEAG